MEEEEEKVVTAGATEAPASSEETEEEQYHLSFRNGALKNLKALAADFSVPEDDLKEVVNKGIKLLTLLKDTKTVYFDDKSGDRFRIDINKL